MNETCKGRPRDPLQLCGKPARYKWRLEPMCFHCFCKGYFNSSQWEKKREYLLVRSGRKCERCGARGGRGKNGNVTGFNVHHLTYERLGKETLEDLVLLCRACHEAEHGIR